MDYGIIISRAANESRGQHLGPGAGAGHTKSKNSGEAQRRTSPQTARLHCSETQDK